MTAIVALSALVIAIAVLTIGLRISLRKWHSERSRMLALSTAIETDAIGGIGISILCPRPSSVRFVEALLDARYPAVEVVVAIDAERDSDLLIELRTTYLLVAVNPPIAHADAPTPRALYRSRNRSFRRLVVIDIPNCDIGSLLNAAICAASFDALAAILADSPLHPSAAGRIAIEIARSDEPLCFEPFTSVEEVVLVAPRHIAESEGLFARKNRTLMRRIRHIEAILTMPISETDHFMLEERPTYTFLNILSLKIMRYGKFLLSLVKHKTERQC